MIRYSSFLFSDAPLVQSLSFTITSVSCSLSSTEEKTTWTNRVSSTERVNTTQMLEVSKVLQSYTQSVDIYALYILGCFYYFPQTLMHTQCVYNPMSLKSARAADRRMRSWGQSFAGFWRIPPPAALSVKPCGILSRSRQWKCFQTSHLSEAKPQHQHLTVRQIAVGHRQPEPLGGGMTVHNRAIMNSTSIKSNVTVTKKLQISSENRLIVLHDLYVVHILH